GRAVRRLLLAGPDRLRSAAGDPAGPAAGPAGAAPGAGGVMGGESTLVSIAPGAIFAYSFYAVLVAGQLSLGQAGFAALAGFVAAALAPDPAVVGPAVTLAVAIVIGMLIGALAAIALGLPTMHLRGVFLAIATLA